MKHKFLSIISTSLSLALLVATRAGSAADQQPAQPTAPVVDDPQRPTSLAPTISPSPRAADIPTTTITTTTTVQPQPPGVVTSSTTPSPFKLPTIVPELDFNKDLLDYDNELLANLKFHPSIAELNQVTASVNNSSAQSEVPGTSWEAYERWLINRYHDHDALHGYLLQLAQAYPQVTRLYEVGTSVEGRKLWALEISESPGKHEILKPEFRYIANMHGNEVVGRELLLHLARLLLENYYHEEPQVDANKPTGVKFVKKLIKATRIHLMPTMNPDGFARSDVGCKYEEASQKGRLNANNVDLNRNFPDEILGTQADAATQPEVRALMDWSRREPFVLSANLHGGAVVAVVPYDSAGKSVQAVANVSAGASAVEERRTPDHATYLELARAYSRSHPTMWRGEMCYDKCTEYHQQVFPNEGITTGAGWYSLHGSMQDWMYENTNDFHLTLEIGCNQYPPAEALHQYWTFNKPAMLSFMRQVHRGIKGTIEDFVSGRPLAGVRIHVRNIDHNVTSTQAGDYFRLLAPGNYVVTFEHAEYHPIEIFVSVRSAMAQIHNIKMKPRNGTLATLPPASTAATLDTTPIIETEIVPDDGEHDHRRPQLTEEENQHALAVATLIISVIILLLIILLAGAYVVQKRRFSRSQSVSMEMQPSGRSTAAAGTSINLPPLPTSGSSLKSASAGGSGGGSGNAGRSLLSPHVA